MNGRENLRQQLEEMGHALRAFDDPLVDEHPGLRLMKDVLASRQEHLARELDEAERCHLTAAVEHAGDTLPVDLAVPLLAAVQEAVRHLARARAQALPGVDAEQADSAVALRVGRWEGTAVTLTGPDVPLPARVADPASGITLVEVVLGDLLDGLAEGSEAAVEGLAALLAAHPLAVTLTLSPIAGEERRLRVERSDAARLSSP